MVDGVVGVKQSTTPDRLIDNEVLNIGGQDVYRQRVQDPEVLVALAALLTELQQKLETGGEVALDATTLAALETVNAVVSGTVALDATTLAALETINAVVSGTVALDATTLAALETINALSGQTLDPNNTQAVTSAQASPGTPWVGAWTQTRSVGIVRLLTVLASNVSSGLGGTFTFEFSEDGSTATISEVRAVGSFATVRDFDLFNAGAWYRVKFEPSRLLTGGETVYVTTTLRRQDDGAFVRLANQELEEANAALPATFAFLKAFDDETGLSVNIRPTPLGALHVNDERLTVGQAGSLFTEGVRDDISLVFSRDRGADAINSLVDAGSVGGTITHDASQGQAVLAVAAVAGRTAYFRSNTVVDYEPGHMIRGGQTISISTVPTTGEVRWGWGEDDGAGEILNGIGWGLDSGGLFCWRRHSGVDVSKTYRQNFTDDRLDGLPPSRYQLSGTPIAIDPLSNGIYEIEFEWYGVASPSYLVATPRADPILVHVDQTVGQQTGTTVPEPNLPLFIRVDNGASAQAIDVRTGSWRGGLLTNKVALTGQRPDGTWAPNRASGLAYDRDDVELLTTAPLAGSGVWQSGWVSTDGWDGIEISIASDVVSASDGILVEFTDDPFAVTPIVRTYMARTFGADDVAVGAATYRIGPRLIGFRLTYTNGGTLQGNFFLGVMLRGDTVDLPQGPLTGSLNGSNNAVMTRGAIAAPNASGAWSNVERGTSGGLDVGIVQHEVETPLKALSTISVNQSNVTTSAALIVNPTANRRAISIRALIGNGQKIYVGPTSAVTSGNGYELAAGAAIDIDLDETQSIYMVSNSGTQRVCWMEALRS